MYNNQGNLLSLKFTLHFYKTSPTEPTHLEDNGFKLCVQKTSK